MTRTTRVNQSLCRPMAVRRSLRALTTIWVGVGLTLPFYGAETFGLAAIGQHAYERSDPSLVAILEAPDRRA